MVDADIIRKVLKPVHPEAKHAYEQALAMISSSIKSLRTMGLNEVVDVLQERYDTLVNRGDNYLPFRRCLVAPLPPPVNRENIRGLLAYREWRTDEEGLSATIYSEVIWKEVMAASGVPSADNRLGLHARLLRPNLRAAGATSGVCGFVEMLGHIEEHSDGVIRGEYARIVSIYYLVTTGSDNSNLAFGLYELLRNEYPCTPLYVVNQYQMDIILMREILISNGISLDE